MKFIEKLLQRAGSVNSWVCVGLDPVIEQLPESIRSHPKPVEEFNRQIVHATKDVVCAYKLNLAFYESSGIAGWKSLEETLRAIPSDVVTIADGKRGDIGNTSKQYARSLFEQWGFDAQTVNPYLGMDALEPFLSYSEKGIFVLCLTSNPGAADFQRLMIGKEPLFCRVAEKVIEYNRNGNCGLVVGATQAEDLPTIRKIAPSLPFLIPGIGAQGGDLAAAILEGTDKNGNLALINASRSILYASEGADFAAQAHNAAIELRDQINHYRKQKN